MSGLTALLELQAQDTAGDQLRHRRSHLPELAALGEVDARYGTYAARLDDAKRRQADASHREARLDEQVGAMDHRVNEIEKRMYSGEVSATKDLLAMTAEITAIKGRRSALDDDVLAVMEEGELLALELADLKAEGAVLDEQRAALVAAIAAAEALVDQELAEVATRRSACVVGVPAAVLSTYETLRARLGGVGAAKLVGTSCTGCHLTLPSAEVARIKREPADAVVLCDQCGRILIR
ncbi:MAG: C4-type zinc ribbon domain-containing protein [Acidimicrobiales bacterium]